MTVVMIVVGTNQNAGADVLAREVVLVVGRREVV